MKVREPIIKPGTFAGFTRKAINVRWGNPQAIKALLITFSLMTSVTILKHGSTGTMSGQCWASVYDAGPTLPWHWNNAVCLAVRASLKFSVCSFLYIVYGDTGSLRCNKGTSRFLIKTSPMCAAMCHWLYCGPNRCGKNATHISQWVTVTVGHIICSIGD